MTIGKALREKIVGKQNTTPIKKKLAKTFETIKKVNEQIKDEEAQLEQQPQIEIIPNTKPESPLKTAFQENAPSLKTASQEKDSAYWRSEAIRIVNGLRNKGKRGHIPGIKK